MRILCSVVVGFLVCSFEVVAGDHVLPGLGPSLKKAASNVRRFHLGEHLKKPTSRERRLGLTTSERFEKNPHLIVDRESDRDLRAALYNAPNWVKDDVTIVKEHPQNTNPGKIPVKTDETQDAMPFGDGPGVFPGVPNGTVAFWEGTGYAEKMWEVIACPVADVEGFLSNPLACFFGNLNDDGSGVNSNPYEFFADIFQDTDAISCIVTDIVVDTAIDIIVGVLPVDLFGDIFDALCPLFDLINEVLGFLGGGGIGDFEEDGCIVEEIPLVGGFLASFSPLGIATCASEDAVDRRLEEIDEERRLQESLYMTICSDAIATERTPTNPSGYGYCGSNQEYRCVRPFATSQPDSPGVCLPTSLVDKIGKGEIQLSNPFLMQIYGAIQNEYTTEQLNRVKVVLETLLLDETNQIDSTLSTLKEAVDDISTSRRHRGLRTSESAPPTGSEIESERNHDQKTEDNPPIGDDSTRAYDEYIDSILKGDNVDEINRQTKESGIPGHITNHLTKELLKLTKGPQMKSAREYINEELGDEILEVMSNPTVLGKFTQNIQQSLKGDPGKALLTDMTTQLLKMAKNKKTGRVDIRKLKAITNDFQDAKRATDSGEPRLPRFLAETTAPGEEGEFCENGALRELLSNFIKPVISSTLSAVSGAIELANGSSIANKIFELTNFWDSTGPMAALFEGLLDIFQFVAALFLFGPEDGGEAGTGDYDTDAYKNLIDKLPSNGRVLPIRQDRNGNVYMASGCDSNFEGELQFYGLVKDIILKTLKALSEAVGQWLNAPIELVKWLLEMLFKAFDHMNDVCEYLDDFVQLGLVEGTFENSRYILQETVCRPVAALLKGHGCDGIDNNCDFDRDECGEDVFPPEIDAALAFVTCSDKIFATDADAKGCFASLVSAVDDCKEVEVSVSAVDTTQCDTVVRVQAIAQGCGNRIPQDTTTLDYPVKLDNDPPEVTCELGTQGLSGNGAGVFTDLQFSFTASDGGGGCTANDDLKVTIEVYSTEVVETGEEMVSISTPTNPGEIPTIWAEDIACNNANSGKCKISSGKGKSREYFVRVQATDEAGNVGTATCNTWVGQNQDGQGEPRFLIRSLAFVPTTMPIPTPIVPVTKNVQCLAKNVGCQMPGDCCSGSCKTNKRCA